MNNLPQNTTKTKTKPKIRNSQKEREKKKNKAYLASMVAGFPRCCQIPPLQTQPAKILKKQIQVQH